MKRRRVAVEISEGSSVPAAFRWRGRWRRVERVVDAWREAGRWWLGEPSADLVRVEAGGVFVLSRLVGASDWYLEGEED
jgi:hypothetical protein